MSKAQQIQQIQVRVPDKMVPVPTEEMELGDVMSINHPNKNPALRAMLDADATLQNKTFAVVHETLVETVVVCVRTEYTIWPYAIACTPAENLIGDHRGKRFGSLQKGNRLQVVNFAGHPHIRYKPLNLATLRAYVSKLSRQNGTKFIISKTNYGAEVWRVA